MVHFFPLGPLSPPPPLDPFHALRALRARPPRLAHLRVDVREEILGEQGSAAHALVIHGLVRGVDGRCSNDVSSEMIFF